MCVCVCVCVCMCVYIYIYIYIYMDCAVRVQILDKIVCILHSTNNLGLDMHVIILSPAMGRADFSFGIRPV